MDQPSVNFGELGAEALEGQLGGLRESAPSDDLAEAVSQIRGAGESEDGRVQAVLKTDGTLVDLTIDPRVLRSGSEAVAETVKEAVNAAAADTRARLAEALSEANAPTARVAAGLERGLQNVIDQVMTDVARAQDRLR